MIARINDSELFKDWLYSCTGIAYKEGTSLVKINPITKELITLDENFNKFSLDIVYNDFEGEEIDTKKTSIRDKWLVAMGGDNKENDEIYDCYKSKFIEYKENYYEGKLREEVKNSLMNFYTRTNIEKDWLGCVGFTYGSSSKPNVFGEDCLRGSVQFALIMPSKIKN